MWLKASQKHMDDGAMPCEESSPTGSNLPTPAVPMDRAGKRTGGHNWFWERAATPCLYRPCPLFEERAHPASPSSAEAKEATFTSRWPHELVQRGRCEVAAWTRWHSLSFRSPELCSFGKLYSAKLQASLLALGFASFYFSPFTSSSCHGVKKAWNVGKGHPTCKGSHFCSLEKQAASSSSCLFLCSGHVFHLSKALMSENLV